MGQFCFKNVYITFRSNIHWQLVLKVVLKSRCHNRKTPVPVCLPNGLYLLTTVLFQEAASGTQKFPLCTFSG